MHFSRTKGRSVAHNAKGARLAHLLCGLLGIATALLFLSGTVASPNAAASNSDERPELQAGRKASPTMVWTPEGTFLITTD